MKKIFAAAVISAALLTGLTACGSSGHVETGSTKADTSHTQSSAPTKAVTPTNPLLGQTYVFDDGLSVSVSKPTPYTPSANAAGATNPTNLIFTITIKNSTKENFDPSLILNSLNSGSTAASPITDIAGTQGDVTGFAPQTPLTPGQSVSWKTAYSVTDGSDLTMSVKLNDFAHKDLLFASK